MKHSSRPVALSWFQDTYKGARLALRPPFQRKPVWADKQRHALIESILLDIPVPEIYIQVSQGDDDVEQYGVVDGQQRLRTILQFIGLEREEDQIDENQNSFSLDKIPKTSKFYDMSFSELDKKVRGALYQYEICVRFLYTEDQKEVEDVFKRLNKYTMPLKPQELRNATYHGAFATLSERLADDEYWAVNRIMSPAAIRRMGDIELMSDLLIGVMHGPQGGAAKLLDQYYETYEQYEDELPGQAKLKKRFDDSLKVIKAAFPEIAIVPRWGNKADFYSLFVGISTLVDGVKEPFVDNKGMADKLIEFAGKVDQWLEDDKAIVPEDAKKYGRAIQKGSNEKARRMDRHETVVDMVSRFFKTS